MAERDLVTGVVQLGNLLTRRLAPLFERQNVTPQQWFVLAALFESGEPMTLAAVARSMLVSKQNMTGMVARLEHLGLVERIDDPADLRASRIRLTRRGRGVVEKLRGPYRQWVEELGGREARPLTHSINRLIAQLQQTEDE
ncbi:MAG TPA: MarR family transcriptional regulator [Thermoanaerobaculia bacterium]|nr:MarR family transcriptional regulator [Thermoanaerobaculia bacterium]